MRCLAFFWAMITNQKDTAITISHHEKSSHPRTYFSMNGASLWPGTPPLRPTPLFPQRGSPFHPGKSHLHQNRPLPLIGQLHRLSTLCPLQLTQSPLAPRPVPSPTARGPGAPHCPPSITRSRPWMPHPHPLLLPTSIQALRHHRHHQELLRRLTSLPAFFRFLTENSQFICPLIRTPPAPRPYDRTPPNQQHQLAPVASAECPLAFETIN